MVFVARSLICSMNFFSPKVVHFLYKLTLWPCMEYYFRVWAGAPSCYKEMLDS